MQRWLSPQVGLSLVAALYLLSFPYHPGLRSPNELCRLWQSRALIDDGTLNINGALQRHGMVGDLSCTAVVSDASGARALRPCVGPDAPRANVTAVFYYPSKAPLLSFLGAPVCWGLKQVTGGQVSELLQVLWSRVVLTIAPTLALLALLRRFLEASVAPRTAALFTVVYALGTMAFSYAEAFMSHQVTGVLLFAAFFSAWKVERGDWGERGYLLAGLAAGAAVVAEYTAALGVVCVASYTVAARWGRWAALARAAAGVVVGAAPLLAALLWYHQATFGSPFVSGYKFLNDAAYMGWHQGGFLGIKVPDPAALGLSLFSPLRGLFVLSPFLLAVGFGLGAVKAKERAQFVFLVVLLVAHAYFTSSFSYASWGWTVGPRHLTGVLPFLVLPVALVWERVQATPWKAGVLAGALAVSVLVTGLVGFVNYVPDDVSTSVFGLVWPVWSDGFWPVSWLAAFVPNPASGAVLVVLLGAAVLWVISQALRGAPRAAWGGAVVAVVLHLGVLKAFTRGDAADLGAVRFIESVWVAKSGVPLDFRGNR